MLHEARGLIKGQCLANFFNELTGDPNVHKEGWILSVDGSSNTKGRGVRIVLQGPNDLLLEQALCFGFKPSNN